MNMTQLAVNNIIMRKKTGENGALNKKTRYNWPPELQTVQIESEIYSLKIENESLKSVQNKQMIILKDLQEENVHKKMQMKETMIQANNNEQYRHKSNRRNGILSSSLHVKVKKNLSRMFPVNVQ